MCGPEFSDLEAAVHQRYNPDDVVVFGMSAGHDTAEDLAVFVEAFQITFPILLNVGNIHNAYHQSGGVSPYPLDYVIDQNGNVAYFSNEYQPEEIVQVINDLLDLPSPVEDVPLARALALKAAPNPFNPRTDISFELPRAERVTLDILDPRGRLVRRLLNGTSLPAGPARVTWQGLDRLDQPAATGVYFARLTSGSWTVTLKLALVR